MKKIKALLRKFKKKLLPARDYLSEGRPGALLFLAIPAFILITQVIGLTFSSFPLVICAVIAALLLGLGGGLIYLITRLLFGNRSITVLLFILDLFLFTALGIGSSMGEEIPFAILLSLAAAMALDIGGRCFWTFFIKHDHRLKPAVLMALCFIVIGGGIWLCACKGIEKNNMDRYLSMLPEAGPAPEGFSESVAKGPSAVKTLSYGPGTDLDPGTYDLSRFAQREGLTGAALGLYFDNGLEETPIAGKVWYPDGGKNCPTLFIIHGNHDETVPSFEGYDYLGEFLASWGYVVVSVDENYCNTLSDENDARAILLLENIKKIFSYSDSSKTHLYERINKSNIALAGHSRGGEAAVLAYYLNSLSCYPDNGNIEFDYGFDIKSLIAIAPVADQYTPSDFSVRAQDVSFLLLHGMNDQDVCDAMGQKLYNNISFTGEKDCLKSFLYIYGANHGQFNSQWGINDLGVPVSDLCNFNNFISQESQQRIAQIAVKTFLDVTLKGDETYSSLFTDIESYRSALPETVYAQTSMTSDENVLYDLDSPEDPEGKYSVSGAKSWSVPSRELGSGGDAEDHGLLIELEGEATAEFTLGGVDLTGRSVSLDIGDARTFSAPKTDEPISYELVLTDKKGNTAKIKAPVTVLPAIGVQNSKLQSILGSYTPKNSLTTVRADAEDFEAEPNFDLTDVWSLSVIISGVKNGSIILDNVALT
ncbi:MAG: hypothetical protein IJ071_10995 [Ruminococcus sp.]|nr:hypothetical protein [Ruminococcus sp.]